MTDPSLALTEQLIQETIPKKARCGGKALTLLFLVIGLKLTVLLSQVPWSSSRDGQHLVDQDPGITMVLQHVRPARAIQLPKMASTLPFSQASKAKQFMSPGKVWQSMQPARQFTHSTVATAVDDKITVDSRATAVDSRATATSSDALTTPQADSNDAMAVLKKKFGPLGDLIKKYGPLALGFHFTVWSLTLGSSFALFSFGLGVEAYLPAGLVAMLPAGSGNLAAAYIITEATGPVRTLATLGIVPILGKALLPEEGQAEMQMSDGEGKY